MGSGLKRTHHRKTLLDYSDYTRIKRGDKRLASRLTRRRARQELARSTKGHRHGET